MHKNAVSGVTLATEIANATVHAITRENSECSVIRFIATSKWKAGDTATVDGVPVTALLPSGETLPDGAYVINANVLCILTGSNLTVYVERKKIDKASEIAYNDTNVANELDTLNSNLSTLVKTKTMSVTTNDQGSFYLDLYQTNTILSLDDKSGHAYVIIPFWYQEHYYAVAFELTTSGLKLVINTTISVTVKYIEGHLINQQIYYPLI